MAAFADKALSQVYQKIRDDLKKDPVLNQLRNFHGGQNDKVVQAIAESYKQELQTRKIYKQELPTHKK